MSQPSGSQREPIPASQSAEISAQSAGRGGLWLSGAKLYFTLIGLIQQISLSWLLGDGYGALRGVLSPASITYNPLVTAGVQGMSRALSRVPAEQRPQAIRLGFTLHAAIAALVAAGFFALAPLLGRWLHSEYLVPSLRILSLVILFYGVYAPAVGVLNGSRRFGAQAALDMLSVTLRTLALFGGAWWLLDSGSTRAVEGASWGFVAVALLLACLAVLLVGLGKTGKSVLTAREHLGFVVPVILAQVVLNLLLQADTNTLRGFATRAAVADGREPEAADALVGAYNAAQLFGFLPYQLLVGVTFILFPLLATAHAGADRASVARYVREGTRIALLVIGLSVGISAGLSEGLLRLVFPPQFAELGTSSLRVLSVGLGAFALFGVMTTVLNSLGRQWQSLLVTGLALGVVFVLNLWWLRGEPFGRGLLEKTAWATSLGMFAAAAVSAFLVKRAAGASFEPSVLLRVVVAVLACVLVARQLPASSKPLTVVLSLALALGYLGVLIVLRVLGPNDWRRVMSIVGRSR